MRTRFLQLAWCHEQASYFQMLQSCSMQTAKELPLACSVIKTSFLSLRNLSQLCGYTCVLIHCSFNPNGVLTHNRNPFTLR